MTAMESMSNQTSASHGGVATGHLPPPSMTTSGIPPSRHEVPRVTAADGLSPGTANAGTSSSSQPGSHCYSSSQNWGNYSLSPGYPPSAAHPHGQHQQQQQQPSSTQYTHRPPYHSSHWENSNHAPSYRGPHSPHAAAHDGLPPAYDSHGYGPGSGGAGGGASGAVAGQAPPHGQLSPLTSQVAPPRPPPSILESQSQAQAQAQSQPQTHHSHSHSHTHIHAHGPLHPSSSHHHQPPTPTTAPSSAGSHLIDSYQTRVPASSYYGSPASTPQQPSFSYQTLPSPGHQPPTAPGSAPRLGMTSLGHHHPMPMRTHYNGYPMGPGVLTNMTPTGHMPLGMVPPSYMQHGIYTHHHQVQQDRPFKCDQCQQSFNRNHDLKRHKRIHLAVKPFPCGNCEKSFSRKDALKRHRLVKNCGSDKNDKNADDSQSR